MPRRCPWPKDTGGEIGCANRDWPEAPTDRAISEPGSKAGEQIEEHARRGAAFGGKRRHPPADRQRALDAAAQRFGHFKPGADPERLAALKALLPDRRVQRPHPAGVQIRIELVIAQIVEIGAVAVAQLELAGEGT